MTDSALDAAALRAAFHAARLHAGLHARYGANDPTQPPLTCRYCGKYWRRWAGSQLDGHAGCFVTEAFKQQLVGAMRPSTVTCRMIAQLLGVTVNVVRAWTWPIRHMDVRRTPDA